MTPLSRNRPQPLPRPRPRRLRAPLPSLLALLGLVAGCGSGAGAEQSARGLVPLDPVEFVAPEHRDHDSSDPGHPDHALLREGFQDFGDVPFGETAHHTFRLANTDPVPVTIQQLDASCTCSIPRVWYTDPETGERIDGSPTRSGNILTVPPGVEVRLEVSIDTRNVRSKNIDKLISLRITSDSQNRPFTTLEMHMVVTRDFALYPRDDLDLGLVPVGTGKAGSLQLTQDGDSGAVLTELLATSDEHLAASLDYEFGQSKPVWRLHAALAAGGELGAYHGWVRLASNLPSGEPGPVLEVRVNARVVEDVHVPRGRLILTGDPPTAWVDVEAVGADVRLALASVELRGAGAQQLEVRAEPREPGDDGASRTWRVVLAQRAGTELPPGSLTGVVSVRFGAPIEVEKEIPYVYVPR